MRDSLTFLASFLRHPTQVGAIAPSGAGLAAAMTDWFPWHDARNVVEYGSGTGVFTAAILECLHPQASFFAIERAHELAQTTRQRCPSVTVYEDSVTNVAELCQRAGMEHVDAIVCGLPWASFSASLQDDAIEAMFSVLRPGGRFATFAYWQGVVLPAGRRFSARLHAHFTSVERSQTVWKNLPPAFVYRCIR